VLGPRDFSYFSHFIKNFRRHSLYAPSYPSFMVFRAGCWQISGTHLVALVAFTTAPRGHQLKKRGQPVGYKFSLPTLCRRSNMSLQAALLKMTTVLNEFNRALPYFFIH